MALFPLVLLALGGVLLIATFAPLFSNLTDDGPTLPDDGGRVVEIEGASPAVCVATMSTPRYLDYDGCDETGQFVPIGAAEEPDGDKTVPPWDFCVVLTADRIDYQQGRLTGQVALHFPQAFLREIKDLEGRRLLEYSESAGSYLLTDAADAEASFLYVRVLGLDGRQSVLAHVPFGDIPNVDAGAPVGVLKERVTGPCNVNDEYRIDFQIELPVAVHPQAYPYDRYALSATFELVAPPGLSLGDDGDGSRYRFGTLVPYTLHVGTGAALSSMRFEVSTGPPIAVAYRNLDREGPGDQIDVLRLNLVVTRDTETRLFVLAALAVPFALYIALLSLVLSRRSDDLGLGLLGIVAGFLSVLPLRQVLVPAEVPGLTRVDFILGFQLTLMIATFLGLRAFSWRRDKPAAAAPAARSRSEPSTEEPATHETQPLPSEPSNKSPEAPPPSI